MESLRRSVGGFPGHGAALCSACKPAFEVLCSSAHNLKVS